MTKSFDDAVTHHKNNLIENLSQFHEGYRVRGLLMDVESNKSDYEYYFNTGKQSRQVEIELLEKEIIETQEFLNNQNCIKQAEIDELTRELEIMKGCAKIAQANGEDKLKYLNIISEALCALESTPYWRRSGNCEIAIDILKKTSE